MKILNPLNRIRDWWQQGRLVAERRAQEARPEIWGPLMPYGKTFAGSQSTVSVQELVRHYQGWPFVCANINGDALSKVPLRLYVMTATGQSSAKIATRELDRAEVKHLIKDNWNPMIGRKFKAAPKIQEVLEHSILTLFDQVNPNMNRAEFLRFVSISQDMTGDAYVKIQNSKAGVPVEMWPLLPQFVEVEGDKVFGVSAYKWGSGPTAVTFKPEEVLHHKYLGLRSMIKGMSPLEADIVVANMDEAMNLYEYALLENQAIPDYFFTVKGDRRLPEKEEKRFLKYLDSRFKGPRGRGKAAFFYDVEPKQLTLSPKEMSFLQGRRFTLRRICALYGVPEAMVTAENVNKANAEAMKYWHAEIGVLPRCRWLEQKWTEWLIPKFDDSGRLFLQFDNPVPTDQEDRRAERFSKLSTWMTSINEERVEDNLPPVDWGERPLVPFNIMPLGGSGGTHVQPAPEKTVRKAPKIAQDARCAHTLSPTLPKWKIAFERMGDAIQIGGFIRALKAVLHKQRDSVLSAMKSVKQETEIMGNVEEWLFDPKTWDKQLADTAAPYMRRTIVLGGDTGAEELVGLGEFSFHVNRPEVQQFLEEYPFKFAQSADHNIAGQLRSTLSEGIEEGESMFDLRKRVEALYDNIEKWQAERIARTESARAFCAGREMAWQQSEIIGHKEWLASAGACDLCLELANKGPVSLGMSFRDDPSGYEAMGIGYPPAHPHCLCDILPSIRET